MAVAAADCCIVALDIVRRLGNLLLAALLFCENDPIMACSKRRVLQQGGQVPVSGLWIRVRSSCGCFLQLLLPDLFRNTLSKAYANMHNP